MPSSPPAPRPSHGRSSRTIPPPTPVPQRRRASTHRPAPRAASASVAPGCCCRRWAGPEGRLQRAAEREGALLVGQVARAVPAAASTAPGDPTPTPSSAEHSTWCRRCAARPPARLPPPVGRPPVGVGTWSLPQDPVLLVDDDRLDLVPPRSAPPRTLMGSEPATATSACRSRAGPRGRSARSGAAACRRARRLSVRPPSRTSSTVPSPYRRCTTPTRMPARGMGRLGRATSSYRSTTRRPARRAAAPRSRRGGGSGRARPPGTAARCGGPRRARPPARRARPRRPPRRARGSPLRPWRRAPCGTDGAGRVACRAPGGVVGHAVLGEQRSQARLGHPGAPPSRGRKRTSITSIPAARSSATEPARQQLLVPDRPHTVATPDHSRRGGRCAGDGPALRAPGSPADGGPGR